MRKKFIKAALNEFFKVEKYEKDRDTSEAEKRGNLKKDLPSTLMTQHLRVPQNSCWIQKVWVEQKHPHERHRCRQMPGKVKDSNTPVTRGEVQPLRL